MPTSAADLLSAACTDADRTIDLRRRLHRHPELGLHLPRTRDGARRAAPTCRSRCTTARATTSVVAVLAGARPGPTVLLRGDMDALPVQEDTGPAVRLRGRRRDARLRARHARRDAARRRPAARRPARRSSPGGCVLMFQPGEEGYHGARFMIDEGLLDAARRRRPAAAYALHV